MNIYLIIFLIILLGLLGWWLSTIRLIELPAGQTAMIGNFEEPTLVAGNTIPSIIISQDLIEDSTGLIGKTPRLDKKGSWMLTIWPQRRQEFTYRYKRFKPITDIKKSGGSIIWEPTIPTKEDGSKLYNENPSDTIALGEWKEENKRTLWVRERENIAIKFTSKDPIRGVKKAYIRFIVWDMTLATLSLYNPKEDAEKAIIDRFQEWAKDKPYFDNIQGIGWASVAGVDFIKKLNMEIYQSGIIVEGIDLFEDFIEPGSQDVYDAQEKIAKGVLLKNAATIDAQISKIEGEGVRDKQLVINEGQKNLLEIENNAAVDKDKRLKTNEIDQHNQNLENEKRVRVAQFKEETIIAVNANGTILDKVMELKKTADATLTKKYNAIARSDIHTYVEGSGSDSPTDTMDEDITGHVKANLIVPPKPGGTP